MTNKLEEVLKELQDSHVLVEKVKVPKFIADWIEDHKAQYSIWDSDSKGEFIIRCSVDLYRYDEGLSLWDYKITDKVSGWIDENKFGFISSVLFGYETEEEKDKFEVGEYYFAENMICRVDKMHEHLVQMELYDFEVSDRPVVRIFNDDATCLKGARKATDEEIKLFKRAEMYRKHGRKLDELKIGDLLIDKGTSCEIYQVEDHHGAVEDIIAGLVVTEIYLTVEEQEEAYKKIVGE